MIILRIGKKEQDTIQDIAWQLIVAITVTADEQPESCFADPRVTDAAYACLNTRKTPGLAGGFLCTIIPLWQRIVMP